LAYPNDEEALKAELTDLTQRIRKVRHELGAMTTAPSKDPTRALLHVPSNVKPGISVGDGAHQRAVAKRRKKR
jgi:hypothetical protein